MSIIPKKKLRTLFNLIIEEAEKNDEFAKSLSTIFEDNGRELKVSDAAKRGANRRDKAVLDPIKLAEENQLTKEALDVLTEKELKDIIAEHGMDSAKLAMKWKDKERLIQLILETSIRRASKGDAFRSGS